MSNLESLRKNLVHLNDEALLEVDPEELTEEAKAVYEEELASRGLAWPSDEEAAEEGEEKGEVAGTVTASSIPDIAPDDIVSICRFESVADASFAISLLRHEKIPVWVGGSKSRSRVQLDPNAPLDLHTMPEYLEAAQLLLNTEISEEELARLAEEAGQEEPE